MLSEQEILKNVHKNWGSFFHEEASKDYFKSLIERINDDIRTEKIIYPEYNNIFKCFEDDIEKISVIILGQDPYHGENQANGLAFSVNKNIKVPPSLRNIFKEIESQFNISMDYKNGDLTYLKEQGVLLLNSVLTVEKSKPGSHKNIGWEIFSDNVIKYLSNNFDKKIFILWGNFSISKAKIIDQNKHIVLTSPHPSPLSAYQGFWGNNHFKMVNKFLSENNKKPIIWNNK